MSGPSQSDAKQPLFAKDSADREIERKVRKLFKEMHDENLKENSLASRLSKNLQLVRMLIANSVMMQNLMMDLLDLAQIENNTFKLNKAFFSLTDAVKQAYSVVQHNADRKGLQLVGPIIQPETQQFFDAVYCDKSRLIQVVVNFLSNSIKFSSQNSKIVTTLNVLQKQVLRRNEFDQSNNQFSGQKQIFKPAQSQASNIRRLNEEIKEELDSQNSTAYIHFELLIQDFGAGIPADKLDKLFVNFGTLNEHQKINQAGRGLGLSICKSIVEQMGGAVTVTSQENKGSIFAISFKVMCRLGPEPNLADHNAGQLKLKVQNESIL
jgi:signal transduction histidine kinase